MACGCKKRREKMQQLFSAAARKIADKRQQSLARKPRKSVGLGG